MPKKALIFGVNGQDGSYLAEFLLGKGYSVTGVVREGSGLGNLTGIRDRFSLESFGGSGGSFMDTLLEKHAPDEIYNLASQSHVGQSWDRLDETFEAGAMLPVRMLDAVHRMGGGVKFFQASSAAVFGVPSTEVQDEGTPVSPCDPYGVAKSVPHMLVGLYRERYGYHLCSGILYNHESPRRPLSFVTRKITNAAARIKLGKQGEVRLGSLDSVRDWGYAPDYVKGFWAMLQSEKPGDYVLATGKGRTVREFAEAAFTLAGLELDKYLVEDTSLVRPNDGRLVGDPSKAERELGWKPSTSFEDMVGIMLKADLDMESKTD